MASLNTLRTKFGIVLSIIIAGALLAFILSLKTEMGFSGQDPKVGVIDGEKITYSEYYNEYERVKAQSGIQESDEQQSAMLAGAVWQSLFTRYVLTPGFERLGLEVTEAERLAMVDGEIPSQAFYRYFADPATGAYNAAAVQQFLAEAAGNPQAQQFWAGLNDEACLERGMQKYFGLVRNGVYANALEVAAGVKAANETYAGKWIGKKYSEVPDSLFEVSNGEIKSYYKKHKQAYKQLPSRSISYVVFNVEPTDDDLKALEEKAHAVAARFADTTDVRAFARRNRNGRVDDRYLSAAQLSADEAEALLAGKMYGPVLKNNEWTISRVVSAKQLPDSIGLRVIALPAAEKSLADSLETLLRGGADFARLAADYSVDRATAANGGEAGLWPFSAFTGEMAEKLEGARKGDIVRLDLGQMIQLVSVSRADKASTHVQVASIVYPLIASEATRRTLHNEAGTFMTKARGSFADAAAEAAVTPRLATLMQGQRTIRGLEDSREVARWAYGAEVGDVSEIFTVGKDYVIATLTEIDDEEYTPIEKVASQIRIQLLNDKKYDHIVAQLSGATLDEQAASLGSEVNDFTGVTFSAFYVGGSAGPLLEPRLVGAIASTSETGTVSAPVKGLSGVYLFQVDDIAVSDAQTVEDEQVRAQAMAEGMAQQYALPAIEQMAEIEDLRGKYF